MQAIERLIGGDSEVEIEVRNSVVQAFAKKHLNEIANDALVAKARKEIYSQIDIMFGEIVKSKSGYGEYKVNPEALSKLKSLAENIFTDKIYEMIKYMKWLVQYLTQQLMLKLLIRQSSHQ